MNRNVRETCFNQQMMKRARKIGFFNSFIIKKNLQIVLDVFFLTKRGDLSILESILFNAIKYHWVYKKFLTSLRLSLRNAVVCFIFPFFSDDQKVSFEDEN